ncbi:MAG: thiol peroxidase [Kiritimatiellae bacterium]|nr:thiol peroxidase [Kiritimatiellia bacterium]
MATITFKGEPLETCGSLPEVGTIAPNFSLTGADLVDVGLEAFAGKAKVLNIVPSLDTGICAMSAKRFHAEIAGLNHAVLLNISADLPFAAKRFCDSEHLDQVIPLSCFRHPDFGTLYGMTMTGSPLKGLLGRAVLVLDQSNRVVYSQLVPEIAQEPDYQAVMDALKPLI